MISNIYNLAATCVVILLGLAISCGANKIKNNPSYFLFRWDLWWSFSWFQSEKFRSMFWMPPYPKNSASTINLTKMTISINYHIPIHIPQQNITQNTLVYEGLVPFANDFSVPIAYGTPKTISSRCHHYLPNEQSRHRDFSLWVIFK